MYPDVCKEDPVKKILLLLTPRRGPDQFSTNRRRSKGCQPATTSRFASSNKLTREFPDTTQPRKEPT